MDEKYTLRVTVLNPKTSGTRSVTFEDYVTASDAKGLDDEHLRGLVKDRLQALADKISESWVY